MGKLIPMANVSGNHFTAFAELSVVRVRVKTINAIRID
jgi:hypothetical protein